ncbi:MAG: sulfatase-like hydrolase/transferase [Gemmatimonadetes bacterium]|nr:sulfatase-like hydrolase/transferase [Gemmatimonadota bacterium]
MTSGASAARRWITGLMIASGSAIALFSLLIDVVLGGSPGFGQRQWALLGIGAVLMVAGAWLTPTGREGMRGGLRAAFAAESRLSPAQLLLLAIALGVFTGLAEVSVLFGERLLTGRILRMGTHVIWVIPLLNVAVLTVVALLLLLLSVVWSGIRSAYVAGFLMALLCGDALLHRFTVGDRLDPGSAWLFVAGVAAVSTRILAGQFRRGWRFGRPAAAGAVLVLMLAVGISLTSWTRERMRLAGLPPAQGGAPNILLIIWDTVRSQNLSLYGYERSTTPNLERWSNAATVFDLALSTTSWTLPGHGTLFTGRYPNELSTDWRAPLDDTHPTLAEVLSDHGYATAGFSANLAYATREVGLARGFAHFDDYRPSPGRSVLESAMLLRAVRRLGYVSDFQTAILGLKRADRITGATLDWLDGERGRDRPFFAFLNYFDAHDPYVTSAPYDTLFGPARPWFVREGMGHRETDPAKIEPQIDAYDRCLAWLDAQFAELMDGLESRGLLDNTIVILSSDHGEHFGELGYMRHGNTLYLPVLHVPLIVYRPGRVPGGVRVTPAVTIRDVPATILDLAGIRNESDRIPGTSLARYWDGTSIDTLARPLYSQVREGLRIPAGLPNYDGDLHSLLDDTHHFIWKTDGTEELYDIAADPDELNNLVGDSVVSGVLMRMRAELEKYVDTGARLAQSMRDLP